MGSDLSVLLTGASGFIGCRTQALLVERGYKLRILSRRPAPGALLVECCVGDVTDLAACRQAVNGVDVIIHLAGAKRDPARSTPVNVQGTENLLTAAMDEGISRFVHVSSVGVLGADLLQARVFDEHFPPHPQNDYERSKWAAEQRVHQAAAAGLGTAILRPANVFGDRDPERGLLTLARSVRDRRFVYAGGRDVVCNYVFVEDVAHAILALVEHPRAVGRIYHLSDTCILGEFVDILAGELGVPRPRLEFPKPMTYLAKMAIRQVRQLPWITNSSALARATSLNNQASFATSRLADELDFGCPVGWRAGLGKLVQWYRTQGLV